MLKATNVSKIYELEGVEVKALININLDIKQGEFVAIVGPSGSGKSTLMHLIGALDTPTTGKIIIDGENISKANEKELAKIRNQKVGFVFQQFNLLSKTPAWQNVEIPLIYSGMTSRTKRENLCKQMLEKVGLADKLYNHPNQLSGGQQQRVAIARALINNPAIILADEPTGALDSKTGKEILQMFKDLNKKEGRTIIMVTHDLDLAEQAQRQIKIKDGEVVDHF
ncbi:ABC transporter ATP-binding protein [Candidatus Beckwithbacteria bacterium]|nr:ABC transporter ATP-binding protein [Candidatus Beckwithbacteria bacterium]